MTPYRIPDRLIAFVGTDLIADGDAVDVASAAKVRCDAHPEAPVLVFDAVTSEPAEIDLRGSVDDVVAHVQASLSAPESPDDEPAEPRKPGRPKLGVVSKEVTLLPRHWDWLAAQPGGASVTLRKLVEQARKDSVGSESVRLAQESAYRFITTMAGNEPGYYEANRALFAGDRDKFVEFTEEWPLGVREHARRLADKSFVA